MSDFKFIIPRLLGDDQTFKIFTEPSLQKIGAFALQIHDKNPELKESIFVKYNAGIEALFQSNDLKDDDIIVFVHNDVGILDNVFREKLEMLFREKPDIGIVGIAGSTEITELGGWWMNDPSKQRGHLIQGKNDGAAIGDGFHLQKGAIGVFDDLVAIDGCLLVTTGKLIKEGLIFDAVTFAGLNDFYDIDICFQVLSMGYKVCVADILIYHQSSGKGSLTEHWKTAKDIFIKKWTDNGKVLPFTPSQFEIKPIVSQIVEIEI